MLVPVFGHRLSLRLKARAQMQSVEKLLEKIAGSIKLKNEDRI